MITTTPIARWYWSERGRDVDLPQEAARRFSSALQVLDHHHLGTPHNGRVLVKVPAPGHRKLLFEAELPFTPALVAEIKTGLTEGEFESVEISASCDGVAKTNFGTEVSEGMLEISVDVSEDYFNVELATYSDIWMPFDLRGREQEETFSRNRPRLSAVLVEISGALGLKTDPDDPTRFGIPTETGVANHFEDDGSPSDVWGRFEIPSRNEVFSQTPKFEPAYKRTACGRVLYFPVRGLGGLLLGYLWASDAEGAASFEARDGADLDGYHAGLVWLERLQDAYERGLSPTAALIELRDAPNTSVAGVLVGEAPLEVDGFQDLQELACE
ncbi:hypothetical protein ABZZ04_37275 [Streptomyces sp. NPDC006435]|uniref:hypothetical protein n=1 Tax=Streptomyces sp. NPDC006435 TaxID=3154300 RepID=UPI0033AB6AA7